MSFGNILRTLRTSKGMTQEQLAKKINLSKANVSKYEADLVEPNLETLALIATVFSVSVDYLLGIQEKAALQEQPLSEKQLEYLKLIEHLNEDEIEKVNEYIEFLKIKHSNISIPLAARGNNSDKDNAHSIEKDVYDNALANHPELKKDVPQKFKYSKYKRE